MNFIGNKYVADQMHIIIAKNDKYLNRILFLTFEIKPCSRDTIHTNPCQSEFRISS